MTKQLLNWPYSHSAIGFSRILDQLQYTAQAAQNQNYPPYNIARIGEDGYRIDMALAGFKRDEIQIIVENGMLQVSGEQAEEVEHEGVTFEHKGISSKAFVRQFTLGEHVEVTDAKMRDGMLFILAERVVPDELKPKTISIS